MALSLSPICKIFYAFLTFIRVFLQNISRLPFASVKRFSKFSCIDLNSVWVYFKLFSLMFPELLFCLNHFLPYTDYLVFVPVSLKALLVDYLISLLYGPVLIIFYQQKQYDIMVINLLINQLMRRLLYSESEDEEIMEIPTPHSKPNIKLKEWLHCFKPNNSQSMKQHIMSFLLSEGLFDAAKSFSEEANIPMPQVDEKAIWARYEIKNLINQGQIEQALSKIKILQPNFEELEENQHLVFSIKCLKVINLIKKNRMNQSVQAAKEQLLPFAAKNQHYVREIERVMSLIAFINVSDCKNSQLAKDDFCNKVTMEVNKKLLTEKDPQETLQALIKVGKWCQKQLGEYLNFPRICLDSGDDIFKE